MLQHLGRAGPSEQLDNPVERCLNGIAADSLDAFVRLGRRFKCPVIEEAPEAPAITRPEDI